MIRYIPTLAITPSQGKRWRLAGLAALGLMPLLAQANTSYDVIVNHQVFNQDKSGLPADNGPVGGEFVFRAEIKINGGEGTLTNVQLTEKLPFLTTLSSVFLDYSSSNPDVVCNVPAKGEKITASNIDAVCTLPAVTYADVVYVDFTVRLEGESTDWKAYASTAAVTGNTDPGVANNQNIERAITTYKAADLKVAITGPAPDSIFDQGSVINYQVQASNSNSDFAFDLNPGESAVVRFTQPQGTTFKGSPSGNDWQCTTGSDSSTTPATVYYECVYTVPANGSLAKGKDLPLLTFPVVVNVKDGSSTALATVKGKNTGGTDIVEADLSNNQTDLTVKFVANAKMDMVLVKSVVPEVLDFASPGPVPVAYTLKVSRNSGLLNPDSITVIDRLPPGVSFYDFTGLDWRCTAAAVTADGQEITCTYTGSLELGAKEQVSLSEITINARVAKSALVNNAKLTNNAEVLVPNEPAGSAGVNNKSHADMTVSNAAKLSMTKGTSSKVLASGTAYTYDIKVTNNGPLNVLDKQVITVTDVLDPKLEFVGVPEKSDWVCSPSKAAAPGGVTGTTITCTMDKGLLAKKDSTLTLNVIPHLTSVNGKPVYGTISNSASVDDVTGRDPFAAPIIGTAGDVKLSELQTNLSLKKTGTVTPGTSPNGDSTSGSEVVYQLTVQNKPVAGKDLQTAGTVVVTDTVENLITTARAAILNAEKPAGASLVAPYENGLFLTASVTLPSNAASSDISGSCELPKNAAATDNSTKVTCTFKNLPVGDDEYVVTIKARQYADPVVQSNVVNQIGSITNKAVANSTDTAPLDGKEISDTATVQLKAVTDLTVTKVTSAVDGKVPAGAPVLYTLNAINNGPSKSSGVTLVDTLPVGAIWVTAPTISGGSCSLNAGTIVPGLVITASNNVMTCSWSNNKLFSEAETQAVGYSLRSATSQNAADLSNAVHVSGSTQETRMDNNDANALVTLDAAEVDVLINMRHSADGLKLGVEPTTYTIKVTNNQAGRSYATGVKMVNVFPAVGTNANFEFMTLDSVTSNKPSHVVSLSDCTPPAAGSVTGQLECDFAWLEPGEVVTITFTMKPVTLLTPEQVVGTIFHDATVSADLEVLTGQDTSKNNQTTDRTSTYDASKLTPEDAEKLRFVDLSIKKSAVAAGDSVMVGDTIDYTLVVTNEETEVDLVGGNAQVVDQLPAGLELVGTVNGCTVANQTVTCVVTDLKAGAEARFAFTAKVVELTAGASSVANTATVTSPGDPVTPNNESTVEVPVTEVDLALTKTVDMATALPGATLTYTLTVVNNGPATSKGAVVVDTLPAGLSVVSVDAACKSVASEVTCQVGELAKGATQVFTVTASINADAVAGSSLVNNAKVKAPGDTKPENDEGTVTTVVEDPAPEVKPDPEPKPEPLPEGAIPVPTLGNAGLALMGLLMAAVAGFRLRRRNA